MSWFKAWFNDGKRITAIALTLLQMVLPWAKEHGIPIPEGADVQIAAWISTVVLLILSKADVKIGAK